MIFECAKLIKLGCQIPHPFNILISIDRDEQVLPIGRNFRLYSKGVLHVPYLIDGRCTDP